ncbi:MAG: FkbM family methyltransferase [Gammaproteobacteria bacterium]|nr:FkbM family methyltransferase [Gammaproteobacteria bacterium]
MKKALAEPSNWLFNHCFSAYRPLYALYKRISDRHERAVIRQLIEPGAVVVDIGANIGEYTAFFSKIVGPTGRVFAFEPGPQNFARLNARVETSANVTTVQSAVGDTNGELSFYLSTDLNVDHRTYDTGDGRAVTTVPVCRLDDYFQTQQRIDFIKIDVQGFEHNVLQGARRVLTDNPNLTLIAEFWPYGLAKAGSSPRDFLKFLTSLGFDYIALNSNFSRRPGLNDLDPLREDQYCNILLSRTSSKCLPP